MTERTFRTPSPSPSRQASRTEPIVHPPVPALPQDYANSPTTAAKSKKPKQRAASQDSYPPRLSSPGTARPNNQRQAPDPYNSQSQQQQSPLIQRRPDLSLADDLERTDSRNSVNFSRPLSPRPQSPLPQSPVAHPSMLTNGDRFPPNVVASISPAQADDIQYGLAQVANQPVKKKKKKLATHSVEGSHLHGGTMASKPVVTPLEPGPTRIEEPFSQDEQQVAPKKKKKKKKTIVTGESSHFSNIESSEMSGVDYISRTDSDSDSNTEKAIDKRAQRASGILQKQPSIVKEDWEGEQNEQNPVTRSQNGTVPEQKPTQSRVLPTPSTMRPPTAANVSRKIGEPASAPDSLVQPTTTNIHALTTAEQLDLSPASSVSLQVQVPQAVRGSSLSPSRSTRFSDRLASDLAAGRKHDPLPRSVSPAKSALKHHSPAPSGSPLDPHYTKVRGASATPSEASDISTNEADALPKRKKSARVSFDPASETVGQIPSDEAVESPSKEKRGWLGMGKSKPTLSTIPSNDDMEELMKPRPQLPSFGSVRGQKSRDGNETATALRSVSTENRTQPSDDGKLAPSSAASSESSSSSFKNTTSEGVSNDHLVGAIFAQESQKTFRRANNEPLPPEVTSVEGGVSFSDSESYTSDEETDSRGEAVAQPGPGSGNMMEHEAQAEVRIPAATQAPTTSSRIELPPKPEVPVLSLSPPTPALEQSKPNDQWEVEVPGGFPVSFDALALLNSSTKPGPGTSDKGLGVIAPNESDSDNDSIYSDAAEDPSELDGTGFGSIDAIIDSPVITTPINRLATIPESPLARVTKSPLPEVGPPSPSWEATQARWSNIAEQTKQSPSPKPVAHRAVQEAQEPAQSQAVVPSHALQDSQPFQQPLQQAQPRQPSQMKKKKKKSAPQVNSAAPAPAALIAARGVVPDSAPRYQNQASAYPAVQQQRRDNSPPTQPFRQSMRTTSPPASEPPFRHSLRNENRTPMSSVANPPKQKRLSQTAGSAVPSVQAQAAAKPATQPRAALQKKHIPPQATAVPVQRQKLPPPPPIPSNDSDSDSSFRRARRSKSTSGGQYTMRRSMRGSAGPPSQGDPRNGVRSVSPVGRRAFSPPAGPHAMRTSMRGSMDNTPTLRGSTDTKRSSSLFGRRQASQPPPVPAVSTSGFGSKMRSRIVDSDDEEDYAPKSSKWRSRFADDSDDDEPNFTPVRGIPRRANDSDSTDLEDSSDEEKAQVRSTPRPGVITNSTSSPAAMGVPQSPTSPQKRGLFGRFRSKKAKEEAPPPVMESPPAAPQPEKTKASQLGFSSAAERDKMIEQTRARLEAVQTAQAVASPPPSSHGKLQRRHMPQRVMSDSWPLPPRMSDHVDDRPGTAESAPVRNGSTRLADGSMRGYHDAQAVGKSGKKKRFPMLRKAFGLKD